MAYTDYFDTVQKVYIGYYQRAADPGGLIYWAAKLDAASGNLNEIIEAFANSAESTALYGTIDSTNIGDVVDGIYNALFGRDAEAGGKAFYVDGFTAGTFTAATIMLNVLNGAQGEDLLAVNNKVDAAELFTTTIDPGLDGRDYQATYSGDVDADAGRTFLSTVTWNPITIPTQSETTTFIQGNIADPGDPILDAIPGQTITLTTGIDIKTGGINDDTFDGSVNAQGIPTLTSVDNLDGAGGNDLLLGGLAGGNLAPTLKNIESAEFITAGATTFDLVNTTGLTSLLMRNSSATLTVNNIPTTTGTTFTLQDQASNVNLNFTNGALVGANSFTLGLSGAQATGGGATVAIAQQAGTDTSGLETVTLNSGGSTTNFLNSLTVQNAAGTSTVTTLDVTGTQSLTVATALAASVANANASTLTGGLTATFANTASNMLIQGGEGNDALTMNANTGNVSVTGGTGDDTIAFTTAATFNTLDTVAGGDGTDTLSVLAVSAEAVTAALANVSGIERLTLNTAGTATAAVNATRFGEIEQVNLAAGTGAGTYALTFGAGTKTVTVGTAAGGALGGALTINDTGTAATDVLTVTNTNTAAANAFAAAGLTIAGFETATVNTGATVQAPQTLGTVALNGDSTTGANVLNIAGVNNLTIANLTSNSSGLLTLNASGMTGTAALIMSAAPTFTGGVTGTVSITGTANADTLIGHATASSTIDGGAAIDNITGGAAADSLAGGAGNDIIIGGGGNDIIAGGDGDDTITLAAGTVNVDGGAGNDIINMAATLSAGDTVTGGADTDTLIITAVAAAGVLANVSGFETLSLGAAINQDMIQFTNNSTFTRVNLNTAAGNAGVTNAGSGIATLALITNANTDSLVRLVDTTTDTLTVLGDVTAATATTVTTLTVDNEESLTLTSGPAVANVLTIGTLNAADLTSLTINGTGDVTITNAIVGSANLATVNAAAAVGNVTVNASASTANATITGSLSGSNVLTGGTGADTITGGVAADTLTGGNGADSISGGAGDDVLLGGIGADIINGGIGDDTITGGTGNDTLVGGDGADDFVFTAASNGVDTITGFLVGTDDLNVTDASSVLGGAIAGATTIATAQAATGASIFATDNQVFYISMNGAAANLTNGGANTLSTADMTATTLTNLATYLYEQFNAVSAINANDVVIAVNWTAGGSTTSYVYEAVNNGGADALVAAELTLIGVVDRSTTVMAAGDLI